MFEYVCKAAMYPINRMLGRSDSSLATKRPKLDAWIANRDGSKRTPTDPTRANERVFEIEKRMNGKSPDAH